jgi:hypothetical protein
MIKRIANYCIIHPTEFQKLAVCVKARGIKNSVLGPKKLAYLLLKLLVNGLGAEINLQSFAQHLRIGPFESLR